MQRHEGSSCHSGSFYHPGSSCQSHSFCHSVSFLRSGSPCHSSSSCHSGERLDRDGRCSQRRGGKLSDDEWKGVESTVLSFGCGAACRSQLYTAYYRRKAEGFTGGSFYPIRSNPSLRVNAGCIKNVDCVLRFPRGLVFMTTVIGLCFD